MTDNDFSGLIFFGYIGISLASTTIVFRKTNEKKILNKSLLRSGILALFFAPCVFIGPGILPLPAIVVLAYSFNHPTFDSDNAVAAIISLLISFAILATISYLRYVSGLYKSQS